ncbi:hypothetical protein MGLY_04390 [Neomoorella glycerini]|uniref:Uncharacterized protein n=1 Tax=Neomoorella glycerini TaxID=55779 RepID=A0A6I5ZNC9_9FIRM|nr:hypothetical protein [Moorella glycerini]QGP91115.1 hypothetical protein MGLY_04390 [Moorella glycerini]
MIKLAGYDGLVLTGEAAFPVWVAVSGRLVDIKEIPGLKLNTALEVEAKIREIKPEVLTVLAGGDNDDSNKEFLQRDLAEQMRLKRVKALSIIGDSYFEIEGSMKDFLPGVSAYAASCLKEHQGEGTVQMAMLK